MKSRVVGPAYLLLFIPYALAVLTADSPTVSFTVAWLGSYALIGLSLSGLIKPLPPGRSALEQLMRPIVLTQVIFVSYGSLTSVFAMLGALGYRYAVPQPFFVPDERYVQLLAQAQRYYVLAHGAFVAGLLIAMDYRRSGEWRLREKINVPVLLPSLSILALVRARV